MSLMKKYSLAEIAQRLKEKKYPISGITELGSTEFIFQKPVNYLGVALHNGSRVRPKLLDAMEVEQEDRFREEDPYTDYFLRDFPIQLIARDSRFEYDLNWEIDRCIYPYGEKKWGLQVWNQPLTNDEIAFTFDKYKEFHALMDLFIVHILENFNAVLVFDIHSFCYQRVERKKWWEDDKPEMNLGTRYINREHFAPIIDQFLELASDIEIDGHVVRVGENVLFPGGYLTRKYASSHNRQVLVLAIEYKKIFMDEWTGEIYPQELKLLIDNFLLTKEHLVRTKV